ncbi:glutamate synthase-related protein [Streptomyces agglomeratus]|uniref:glutamate synthase-related protein n=1 Tax=Streptomyces agglomeratus TaxID=285458 RepID=UPI0008542176|nr:glutamate synthase-related protein [Streptomyces agglomeratus]OEJ49936.1 glutamate synthase [Streptomyces agglomeratus]
MNATSLTAGGFPEEGVRARARRGAAEVFPPAGAYGTGLFGAGHGSGPATAANAAATVPDELDALRLVPPVFMPRRLEKLIELGREPGHGDVDLRTGVGGFASELPLYLSAFGSTRAGSGDLAVAAARQAGRLGIPMVVGENMVPVHGYRSVLLARVEAYTEAAAEGVGGVVVQQSTEDADSEVWNLLYSDPASRALRDSGRLGFELKIGQGAKPGLGGMTVVGAAEAERLAAACRFTLGEELGADGGRLRCATPGTFTEEIVRQQLRFMRNNFPLARTWVKFHPGRDIGAATGTAWAAGADAVTVDGAEGGTGWAPRVFLDGVGLPLAACLGLIDRPEGASLLASGRMWEGGRAVRALALGATAVGLGRAALLAVDEDPEHGLERLTEALALELRLLISALGQYRPSALSRADLWPPAAAADAGSTAVPVGPRR